MRVRKMSGPIGVKVAAAAAGGGIDDSLTVADCLTSGEKDKLIVERKESQTQTTSPVILTLEPALVNTTTSIATSTISATTKSTSETDTASSTRRKTSSSSTTNAAAAAATAASKKLAESKRKIKMKKHGCEKTRSGTRSTSSCSSSDCSSSSSSEADDEDDDGAGSSGGESTSSSESSRQRSNNSIMCRICHSEETSEEYLIAPCYCSGTLRYVHQSCLQQWLKKQGTKSCELCKFEFIMQTRIRSLKNWEKLEINHIERRKILCSVTFHLIVITGVIWSLYVLIERTAHEMSLNQLDWAFWVKLIVVAIGFTGGVAFMYIQCKMYVQLCMRWRRYNRVIIIQPITEELLLNNQRMRVAGASNSGDTTKSHPLDLASPPPPFPLDPEKAVLNDTVTITPVIEVSPAVVHSAVVIDMSSPPTPVDASSPPPPPPPHPVVDNLPPSSLPQNNNSQSS